MGPCKESEINRINDAIENVRSFGSSREASLTITKLEEALMWLEKVKEA